LTKPESAWAPSFASADSSRPFLDQVAYRRGDPGPTLKILQNNKPLENQAPVSVDSRSRSELLDDLTAKSGQVGRLPRRNEVSIHHDLVVDIRAPAPLTGSPK